MVSSDNKKRGTIDKEDAAPPNAALKTVILNSAIDTGEGRDVEIIDTTKQLIQTRIEDE